jgi:hypothetical protein
VVGLANAGDAETNRVDVPVLGCIRDIRERRSRRGWGFGNLLRKCAAFLHFSDSPEAFDTFVQSALEIITLV